MDTKILTALLKGPEMDIGHQLYLAMLWNRVDVVEEKILVHGRCIPYYRYNKYHITVAELTYLKYFFNLKMDLDALHHASTESVSKIMIQAILYQRVKFIELLITNGFVIQSFLTIRTLKILYVEGVRKPIRYIPCVQLI